MKSHGFSQSRQPLIRKVYKAWKRIRYRCGTPTAHNFRYYGGRGITVCKRWQESFENFLQDVGFPPSTDHSIDRINNNLGYEPSNCKWSTQIEQKNNTRRNRIIRFNGMSKTISQWARHFNVTYASIENRLRKGWTIERAMTQPFQRGHLK